MVEKPKVNSVIVLLIIGATAIIGSIPFYCIDKPILIVHQSYKYVRSGPDFIDHQTGIFYGVLLDLVGLCCIYLYFRVLRNLPEDDKYRYHRRGEE